MPLHLYIEAGTEYLIGWAKVRLNEIKQESKDLGIVSKTRWFSFPSGERVYVETHLLQDVIRIIGSLVYLIDVLMPGKPEFNPPAYTPPTSEVPQTPFEWSGPQGTNIEVDTPTVRTIIWTNYYFTSTPLVRQTGEAKYTVPDNFRFFFTDSVVDSTSDYNAYVAGVNAANAAALAAYNVAFAAATTAYNTAYAASVIAASVALINQLKTGVMPTGWAHIVVTSALTHSGSPDLTIGEIISIVPFSPVKDGVDLGIFGEQVGAQKVAVYGEAKFKWTDAENFTFVSWRDKAALGTMGTISWRATNALLKYTKFGFADTKAMVKAQMAALINPVSDHDKFIKLIKTTVGI